MAIQDERDVLSAMRELRSVQPSDESRRAAMQILERSHRARPRWLRIVIPSAIAASALIAIVAFFSWPNSSAGAAENLLHAAQVNDSYKGWVHIGAEDRKIIGGIDYSTVDYSHASRYQTGE